MYTTDPWPPPHLSTQADVRRILAWRDRAARTFGVGSRTYGASVAAPAPSESARPTIATRAAQLDEHYERRPVEVEGGARSKTKLEVVVAVVWVVIVVVVVKLRARRRRPTPHG